MLNAPNRARAAALLLLSLVAAGDVTAEAKRAVPPEECLRTVRQARLAEAAGDFDQAVALLSEAIATWPREILPLEALLRLHRDRGIGGERSSELRGELLKRLENPAYPLSGGTVRFLVDASATETEVLESLVEGLELRLQADDGLDLWKAKALVEERLGRTADARKSLSAVLDRGDSFETLALAIRLDLRLERWEDALRLLEPRMNQPELGPLLGALYLELLAKTGQTQRVMEELERFRSGEGRATLSDVGYSSLLKELAWSLHDAGAAGDAEEIWRRLLADSPQDLETRLVLAHLYSSAEERRAQIERVDQQLSAEQDRGRLLALGTEFLAAGDHERAYDALVRAATSGSRHEALWFNLGLAAFQLQKWDAAADAFRRAVEINDERVEAHANLGIALWNLERCAEAVAPLETAVRLRPERANDYYYLASCLTAIGEPERAAKAMAEYRRLRGDP